MSKRVLYIEDNQDNMRLVVWILEDEGYEVLQAWTAEEGLKVLEQQPVDLVLMDISLPGMNGMEATQMMRANERLAKIPVFALTAHAISEERGRIAASGVDKILTKPLDEEELVAAIRDQIGF